MKYFWYWETCWGVALNDKELAISTQKLCDYFHIKLSTQKFDNKRTSNMKHAGYK